MTHMPHDGFVKAMMSHPQVAKDFFEAHLPQAVREQLNLNTLKLENTSFVDSDLHKHESDLIYSVEMTHHEKAFVYCLVEHQSEADELMAFRLIYYIMQGIKRHIKQHEKRPLPLPLIYPIVLYNGKTPNKHSQDMFTLFGPLETLAREVFLKPFTLIDVASLSADDIQKHKWAGLMELSLQRAKKMQFESSMRLLGQLFEKVQIDARDDIVTIVLKYTMKKYDMAQQSPEIYLETMRRVLPGNLEENIMTLEEAIEARGAAKGKAEGIILGETLGEAKGIDHTLRAIELLKAGSTLAAITKETGLSETLLMKLKESILN